MKSFFKQHATTLIAIVLLIGSGIYQFHGGAVKEDCTIKLSLTELSRDGGKAVIDSVVMPHISFKMAFRAYSNHLDLNERVKAGNYELRRGMSVIEIVRMLKLGEQSPIRLTFNNARSVEQLASKIASQIDADSVELVGAMRSGELASELNIDERYLFSLFIPNTYEVWWTVTPEDLVRRMSLEYNRFWTEARETKRAKLKLSREEVITLASIVYEETKQRDEMPRIAGVYLNRLRRGMKLQADPTVKYALGDFSIRRVLYHHLEHDSPYNTYKYRGLPPSSISLPSIAAIDGVLNHETHNYLYFCARPEMDGYHNFASTFEAHKRNARAFASKLNQMGVK